MSNILLTDHFPNCTPLAPCVSCRAANFLRTKLNEDDFKELIKIVMDQASDSAIDLDASIDELKLPIKVSNSIKVGDIRTVRELLSRTELDLLELPNLGRGALRILRENLLERGRKIGECAT